MAISVVKIVHVDEGLGDHWAFYDSYDDHLYGWFESEDEIRALEAQGADAVQQFCEDEAMELMT